MEQVLKSLTLEFFGKGRHKIEPEQLLHLEGACLLDVRSKEEADAVSISLESIPGVECLNIPINEIPDRIGEIPEEKTIGVFCPANVRSGIAYAFLLSKGFSSVFVLEGGYAALTDAIKPGKMLKLIS
jgi:rhodanese-related sulfurtransferase